MPFEVRPIPGLEGLYLVTRDGRIWSVPRVHGRGMRPGRWLRPGVSSTGYPSVVPAIDGRTYPMTVHRAVALAWVPNPSPATHTEINHRDGVKANCAADNLEWCTRSENLRHAYRTGLRQGRGPTRFHNRSKGTHVPA